MRPPVIIARVELCSTISRVRPRCARRREQRLVDLVDDLGRKAERRLVDSDQPRAVISARPITSICCWPPDSSPGRLVAALLQHRKDAIDGARDPGRRGRAGPCACPHPSSRFSSMVSEPKTCAPFRHHGEAEPRDVLRRSAGDLLCRRERSALRRPATTPAIAFSSVDLPAPFGPVMKRVSPSSTEKRNPAQRSQPAIAHGDVGDREQAHSSGLDHGRSASAAVPI